MTYESTMRRAGLIRRGGAGQHENASADDRANPEQRQIQGRQRPFECLVSLSTSPTSCSIDFVLSRFESIHPPVIRPG